MLARGVRGESAVGCGSGYFARRLARAVTPGGRVSCADIQPEMLDLARRLASREALEAIVPVLASDADPQLPAGALDWVLLDDVYHELQQPRAVALRGALPPAGRGALVEYRSIVRPRTGPSGVGPAPIRGPAPESAQ
jgi:predicted O-methyltransferase YrrM